MLNSRIKLVSLLILIVLFAVGCATVNYTGKTFAPTTNVDVFYSEDDIEREYTIMGHAVGSTEWINDGEIEAELMRTAMQKGADAVLITGIGKSSSQDWDGTSTDEVQINAKFLKYN